MRTLVILLLAAMIFTIVTGCDEVANEPTITSNVPVWQCISDPDIFLTFVECVGPYSYCEVRTDVGVGTVSLLTNDVLAMVNDGCWKRVSDTEPLCGPPPPGWNDLRYSDRVEGIMINGSTQTPMFIHSPLPIHDAIHIEELSIPGK